jgi:hypothetical protein
VQVPEHLDIHLICDNYGTHKTPAIRAWLERHPRFHMHSPAPDPAGSTRSNVSKIDGLYAGRPAIPTARLILQTLATMVITPANGDQPPIIAAPTPLQTRLYELLDIDPRQWC